MTCSASSARLPLTLNSSRARAYSVLPPLPAPPDHVPDDCAAPRTALHPAALFPAMLPSFFASLSPRKDERRMYALPASQSSSADSLSLPLPASPQKASFGDVWQQDGHFRTGGRPNSRESLPWWSNSLSSLAPVLFILIIFPLTTGLVLAGLLSLPITASFPRNLSELSHLGLELQAYSSSGFRPMAHVLSVLSITALWKHAWSIPGSVLLNVLAGVLLSPVLATLLMTCLTAVGSIFATLLATPLAPIISQFFPKALVVTRNALEGGDAFTVSRRDKTPTWVRLSLLRLVGVVPWSGINIACGVAGVSLFECFLGSFIGTLPWTAVTCQIGDILQTVAAASSSTDAETLSSVLRSPMVIIKLALLTFASLVPILARDRLRDMLWRGRDEDTTLHMEGKVIQDAKGQRWWWRARRTASGTIELDARTLPGESEKAVSGPAR